MTATRVVRPCPALTSAFLGCLLGSAAVISTRLHAGATPKGPRP